MLSSAVSLKCCPMRCVEVRSNGSSKANKSIIFYGGSSYTDDEVQLIMPS
jgi:hypothetical protein